MNCKCGKTANIHVTNIDGAVKTESHYCSDCGVDAARGTPAEKMAAQAVADGRRFNEWWDNRSDAERRMGPQCSAYAAYCLGLSRARDEVARMVEQLFAEIDRRTALVNAVMEQHTRDIQRLVTPRCPQCGGTTDMGQRFCGAACSARHEAHERPTWAAARGVDVGFVVVPAGHLRGQTLAQVTGKAGFARTVESILPNGRVACVWFSDTGELERGHFSPEELEVVAE